MTRILSTLSVVLSLFVLSLAAPAWAQQDFRVRSGDVLRIEVLEDSSLNREVLVLPDGRFTFPFAGTIQAGGQTVRQIEAALTNRIASNFATEPNVFVSVQSLRQAEEAQVAPEELVTIDIYFIGEVASPGLREVEPGTTLLQALAQAGGFTNFAATKRIQLRRTDPRTGEQRVTRINYRAIADQGLPIRDPALADGDIILVPERRLFE